MLAKDERRIESFATLYNFGSVFPRYRSSQIS